YVFFFQAEDGIRDKLVTGVQTCALPISPPSARSPNPSSSRSRTSRALRDDWPWRSSKPGPSDRRTLRRSDRQDRTRPAPPAACRSEERRVGKECTYWWSSYH